MLKKSLARCRFRFNRWSIMNTPYILLDVATDADDAEIKRAYLQKVRDYPPDRDPERFQAIHDAYQSIKDQKCRIGYALFNAPVADFDELLSNALDIGQPVKLNPEQFDKLFRTGAADRTYLNAFVSTDRT